MCTQHPFLRPYKILGTFITCVAVISVILKMFDWCIIWFDTKKQKVRVYNLDMVHIFKHCRLFSLMLVDYGEDWWGLLQVAFSLSTGGGTDRLAFSKTVDSRRWAVYRLSRARLGSRTWHLSDVQFMAIRKAEAYRVSWKLFIGHMLKNTATI